MTIKTQRYRTLGTVSALAVAASLLAAGGVWLGGRLGLH